MPRKVEVDVTANTKGFKKGVEDVSKLTGLFQGALTRLGVVGTAISSVLDKFTGKSVDMTAALGIGTAAIGAAVAVGEKAISMYVELGDKIRHYSVLTGQSAEASSRQLEAFADLGVDAETAGAGMFKLAKAVSENATGLHDLGIEIVKNRDGTTDLNATLLNVINAYQLTGDAVRRDHIIFTAFGKSGAAMIPILETNIARLRELEKQVASVYTQKDLDTIREYKIQQKELQHQTDELGISLGRTLLPIQLELTESLNRQIYVNQRLNESIGEGNRLTAATGHARGESTRALGAEYDAAQKAKVAADALAQSQVDAANAAKAEADAENTLYDALNKSQDASFVYRQSLIDLQHAQKDAKDAKYKDAEANLRLEEAYFKVADAAVAMREQQAEVAGTTLTAAQKAQIQIDQLHALERGMNKKSLLYKAIEDYIALLRKIPPEVNTKISASSGVRPGGRGTQSFASGGTVPGPVGSPQLAIVHGGEEITPPGQNGSGSGGIHIHMHGTVIDGPAMDRFFREGIQRARITPGT